MFRASSQESGLSLMATDADACDEGDGVPLEDGDTLVYLLASFLETTL